MAGKLRPKDHAERVALFRMQVLGPVLGRDLHRGDLMSELRVLAKRRYRPPDSPRTRTYSVVTLLRWARAFQAHGLEGLRPKEKRQGDALALTQEQRELLLEIRRQHPSAPTNVILQTLEGDGRLDADLVSAQTLRRLYQHEGLSRTAKNKGHLSGERRRWEAETVGALWHADVCHGPTLVVDKKRIPIRIHALLDDKSRAIVGLRVHSHEREVAMLELFVNALRVHGSPRVLYLDNGSTYRGDALQTACGRLGIHLVHAKPYDPQARGKMERFWRTLREGCLDHITGATSTHDIEVRLWAFVAERYHKNAHASLMGRSPSVVWDERELEPVADLFAALTVRETRRVRTDCTLPVGNIDWELREAFLVGRNVTVARSLAEPQQPPWVEHEGARYELFVVDPVANGKLGRKRRPPKPGIDAVDFDPAEVLLARYLRRPPKPKPEKDRS